MLQMATQLDDMTKWLSNAAEALKEDTIDGLLRYHEIVYGNDRAKDLPNWAVQGMIPTMHLGEMLEKQFMKKHGFALKRTHKKSKYFAVMSCNLKGFGHNTPRFILQYKDHGFATLNLVAKTIEVPEPFEATVEWYKNLIHALPADNPHLKVSKGRLATFEEMLTKFPGLKSDLKAIGFHLIILPARPSN